MNRNQYLIKIVLALGILLLTPACAELGLNPTAPTDASSDTQSAWAEQQRHHEEQLRSLITEGQITLGMKMDEVRSAWGDPAVVETAGDDRYGNQRWVYTSGLIEPWGVAPRKSVVFEQGKVVGWDTGQ